MIQSWSKRLEKQKIDVFITQTIFYKDGPPKTEMQLQYCTVLYEKQFTKPRIRDTIIMDKLSNDRNTEKSP